MDIIKNEYYDVDITGMSSEGIGICRIDGYVVFVEGTAIGDKVKIKITKSNKNYGYGKLIDIIQKSISRVEVDCPVFNQCGGCSYRHIDYTSELHIKSSQVASIFKKIAKIDIETSPIIACDTIHKYRNKAQFPVGLNNDRKLISGFYAKRSHRIIENDNCLLQQDDINKVHQHIVLFLRENKISIYDEQTFNGMIRNIYIRQSFHTREIMICLVSSTFEIPNIKEMIKSLIKIFSNIKSIVVNLNNKKGNVILGEQIKVLYGEDYITDFMCDIKLEIEALSFYQVNTKQAEIFYNKAKEMAMLKNTDILLDLYCGIGSIGLSMARYVKKVIGVEIIKEAVQDAKRNALLNNIDNTEFICGNVSMVIEDLLKKGCKPDVVFVDPPRKGLSIEVIRSINDMNPKRLVMISCNPSTAVRDTALLMEYGYIVKDIVPVDMFPRTVHVETIILMIKA